MWYSNNHRHTVRVCSRSAYLLESVGELIWLLSLAGLLLALLGAAWLGVQGDWRGLWLPFLPITTGVMSWLMRGHAQARLDALGYQYDYATDTATLNGREIAP